MKIKLKAKTPKDSIKKANEDVKVDLATNGLKTLNNRLDVLILLLSVWVLIDLLSLIDWIILHL